MLTTELPADVHVAGVVVTLGTAGVAGCAFTTTSADGAEIQPAALVAVIV